MQELFEYISLTATIFSTLFVAVSIIIKEFFKSPAEIFISSNEGKLNNNITVTAFVAFFFLFSLSIISIQILPSEVQLVIGLPSFILFLLALIIGGILTIRSKKYLEKRYKFIKFVFIFGGAMFIVAILTINNHLLTNENGLNTIVVNLISEYLLFLIFLLIFYYLTNKVKNSSVESAIIPFEEARSYLKEMNIVEFLSNGAQRLSFSQNDTVENNATLYFFYPQSGILEIINERNESNSIEPFENNSYIKKIHVPKQKSASTSFYDIVWNKKHKRFFAHIKMYYNFEELQTPKELHQKKERLKQSDRNTLKRAKIRAESAKVIMNPGLLLAVMTIFLQALIFTFNDQTGLFAFGVIVVAIMIIVSLVTTRREYLIAAHFIHYVSECIEGYEEESQ